MTPEREQLVRDTWARFEPKAPEYARYFYDKLFELDPEAQTMFARANMTTLFPVLPCQTIPYSPLP